MVAENKSSARFFYFIVCSLHVSLVCSALPEGEFGPCTFEKLSRSKRQVCVDGTYEHEDRSCCLCAAGQHLETDCVTSSDDRTCQQCTSGTYNSHPNSQKTCLRCTSCLQANANLEVAEPCTIARDTKCQCKKDHYCTSDTGSCKICHPCTVCESTGIKEACTGTSDAVCNETGANNTGVIVGVVFALLALVAAVVIFLWWKKRAASNSRSRDTAQVNGAGGTAADVEMQPLTVPNVSMEPHKADIAEVLGWKEMEHLAIRSGIKDAVIDSCRLDYNNDSQQQTLRLLGIWVEKHGRDAPTKLIQMLQDKDKKAKAEKIQDILSKGSSSG